MISTLRGLQSSANRSDSVAPMTWRALNALGQNYGSPEIDYERFSALWDAEGENGVLHQIVDKFDASGLVIKTREQQAEPEQQKARENNISKTAKRAALKGIKK